MNPQFNTLENTIKKWLYITDPGLVRVITAGVVANYLPGDPVWLFIVAASGGAKTELLRGLNSIQDVHIIADLTPQTLLSGYKDKGSGLLERLGVFSILVMKDFTTVLTMNNDKRHEIMGQLREIYDGQLRKEYGNGKSSEWTGKLGFIAGVTTIVEQHRNVYHMLGERFIQYKPIQPDPIEVTKRALKNSGKEEKMRQEISLAFLDFFCSLKIPDYLPEMPEPYKEKLLNLAAFCAWARSGVVRDGYGSQEISFTPAVEMPTRLVKQFTTLFTALSIISGRFTDDDYTLIHKIAMDSLSSINRSIIDYLYLHFDFVRVSDISLAIHCPINTVRKRLEDLEALEMAEADTGGTGLPTLYKLSLKARRYISIAMPSGSSEGVPEKSSDTDMDIPVQTGLL